MSFTVQFGLRTYEYNEAQLQRKLYIISRSSLKPNWMTSWEKSCLGYIIVKIITCLPLMPYYKTETQLKKYQAILLAVASIDGPSYSVATAFVSAVPRINSLCQTTINIPTRFYQVRPSFPRYERPGFGADDFTTHTGISRGPTRLNPFDPKPQMYPRGTPPSGVHAEVGGHAPVDRLEPSRTLTGWNDPSRPIHPPGGPSASPGSSPSPVTHASVGGYAPTNSWSAAGHERQPSRPSVSPHAQPSGHQPRIPTNSHARAGDERQAYRGSSATPASMGADLDAHWQPQENTLDSMRAQASQFRQKAERLGQPPSASTTPTNSHASAGYDRQPSRSSSASSPSTPSTISEDESRSAGRPVNRHTADGSGRQPTRKK
jgi:hypothetical protein